MSTIHAKAALPIQYYTKIRSIVEHISGLNQASNYILKDSPNLLRRSTISESFSQSLRHAANYIDLYE